MREIHIDDKQKMEILSEDLKKEHDDPLHLVFDYSLGSVFIPENFFKNSSSIKQVTFICHVSKVEDGAFYRCGISSVRFENGFDALCNFSFSGNPLNEIEVVVKNESKAKWHIEPDAFYHCGTPGEQLTFRMEGSCSAIKNYADKYGYLYMNNKKFTISNGPKKTVGIEKFSITAHNMNVTFREGFLNKTNKHILDSIHLTIHEQEMVMIIGGSGCGKSTLVKQLFGLERSFGKKVVSVSLGDRHAHGYPTDSKIQKLLQKKVYYAPQFTISNENLTVKQEIQKNARMFMGEYYSEEHLRKLTESHNLYDPAEKLLNTKVGNISGGQKKKLMLACSEAMNPLIYVFDEPDSGLDEPSAYGIYMDSLRKKQVDKEGKTVIVISHHPRNIMTNFQTGESRPFHTIFTRLIVLAKSRTKDGSLCGTIAFDGTPMDAREFFGLSHGEPYSKIVSKIMTKLDGGSSPQSQIDNYVRDYRALSAGR